MGNLTRRETLKLAGLSLPLAASGAMAAQAPRKKYLILSCDGGGIRGLLTAKIIERLQKEVPFLDKVDLFAGTSTGGIIALGLASQVTPARLVSLYRDRGPEIFNKREELKLTVTGPLGPWFESIKTKSQEILGSFQFQLQDLIRPKYPNEGLSRALTDIFGGKTLGDIGGGRSALVTTLRLCSESRSWAPLVLHNVGSEDDADRTRVQDGPTLSTKLVDAALATSAAPLYFPPHEHPQFGYCVDGGLFANCPASIALGLACRASKGDINSVRILSIGTGTQTSGIDIKHSAPFAKPTDYGALAWLDPIARGDRVEGNEKLTPAFPLISALFDASSASHNYVCTQALQDKYHRVQVTLAQPVALDDTDRDSLEALEKAADSIPEKDWKATTDWINAQLA